MLSRLVAEGLATCDMVMLSGGTSKGAGDLCHRAISSFTDPGIVVHGVALKPGKPLCLAVTGGKPIVILPGFPTSAIFTFHEFVAPVIRAFAGLPANRPNGCRRHSRCALPRSAVPPNTLWYRWCAATVKGRSPPTLHQSSHCSDEAFATPLQRVPSAFR